MSPVLLGRSASGLLSVSPRRRAENTQLLDVMHEWDQHLGALPPKPHPIGPARRTGERVLTIYGTGVVRRWHAMQDLQQLRQQQRQGSQGLLLVAVLVLLVA